MIFSTMEMFMWDSTFMVNPKDLVNTNGKMDLFILDSF